MVNLTNRPSGNILYHTTCGVEVTMPREWKQKDPRDFDWMERIGNWLERNILSSRKLLPIMIVSMFAFFFMTCVLPWLTHHKQMMAYDEITDLYSSECKLQISCANALRGEDSLRAAFVGSDLCSEHLAGHDLEQLVSMLDAVIYSLPWYAKISHNMPGTCLVPEYRQMAEGAKY